MKTIFLTPDTTAQAAESASYPVAWWIVAAVGLVFLIFLVKLFRAKPPEINEEKAEDGCTDDIY